MESNWAADHLQVIRTLMERSALYRRALAPIMLTTGLLGIAAGAAGHWVPFDSAAGFAGFWIAVGAAATAISYLLARRQALRESEAFWSPPTRRVTQALLPPLFAGLVLGALAAACPGFDFVPVESLPAIWMLLYGCALHGAGFFMARGIKLLGWIFVSCGCLIAVAAGLTHFLVPLREAHIVMGAVFGGLHLAYGAYLFFTEKNKAST
jgi:hypothetical protein